MSDTIAQSFKYRLYPTAQQAATLTAWQEACWEVQRLCIRQRRIAQHRRRILGRGKLPTWTSQSREVTELRANDPVFAATPAVMLFEIATRVDKAYKKAQADSKKRKKYIKVRWAEKAEHVGLFFRGQPKDGTHFVSSAGRYGHWKLSGAHKLGIFKVRMHRAMPAGTQVRQAHITRAADGWYISFFCLVPAVQPVGAAQREANGVDVGCITENGKQRIAAVDDGRIYTATNNLSNSLKRLATLSKLVSNRNVRGSAKCADPNSKRTAKRRQRIARLHQTVARQREHVQQYIAKRLVDTAETVVFEKLNLVGMRRKGKGRRKRGLNRAMSAAAPGRLMQLTKEKAAKAGRNVVEVDPRNTSQACSACGEVGQKKGLNVRTWTCAACGTEHDRDINAARNIKARVGFKNDAGTFSAGVPGEGAASVTSKRRSANLEATTVAAHEVHARSLATSSNHNTSAQGKQRRRKMDGIAKPYQLPLQLFLDVVED